MDYKLQKDTYGWYCDAIQDGQFQGGVWRPYKWWALRVMRRRYKRLVRKESTPVEEGTF